MEKKKIKKKVKNGKAKPVQGNAVSQAVANVQAALRGLGK